MYLRIPLALALSGNWPFTYKVTHYEFRHQQFQVFDLGQAGIKLQTLLKHHRFERFDIIGQGFYILDGHSRNGVIVMR